MVTNFTGDKMKKIFAFFTMLALLAVPVSAMAVAAGDWELVGYVKLETWFDSNQVSKELTTNINRSNALQPNSMGRFRMTAQYSRIGLKINGPETLGAKTKGYFEFDFNSAQDPLQSSSNSYIPRLRHAYFEMDWPGGWQLLMGQYWDFFDDFEPETINDSPFQNHGIPSSHRPPQARLTYKSGPWTFQGMACVPFDTNNDNATTSFGNVNINFNNGTVAQTIQGLPGSGTPSNIGAFLGQRSCLPQFQGQVIYEKDLYGKAGWKDKAKAFTAEVEAAFQHTQYLSGSLGTPVTFGNGNYQVLNGNNYVQRNTQTMTPWIVQGTLFIPVLVTHAPQLAGTASVCINAQIGQGFSFVGNGTDADNSYFRYDSVGYFGVPNFNTPAGNTGAGVNFNQVLQYRRYLVPKYGGFISANYYFTNEWHAVVTYGFDKAFGVNTQDRNFALNPQGKLFAPTGFRGLDPSNIQNPTPLPA